MILIIRTCVRKIFRIIRRNNDKEGMISLNGEYDTIYSSKEAYEKRNYNLNYDSRIRDFLTSSLSIISRDKCGKRCRIFAFDGKKKKKKCRKVS